MRPTIPKADCRLDSAETRTGTGLSTIRRESTAKTYKIHKNEFPTYSKGKGPAAEAAGHLPQRNSLDILKAVKATGNAVPIVVFSLYAEEQYAARALRAGASAYVSKDRSLHDLVGAISTVLAGGRARTFPSSILPRPVLSDREIQVLTLWTKGISREIAHLLRINEKTVSTYRARILLKLNARSVVDLIRYAAQERFVE